MISLARAQSQIIDHEDYIHIPDATGAWNVGFGAKAAIAERPETAEQNYFVKDFLHWNQPP